MPKNDQNDIPHENWSSFDKAMRVGGFRVSVKGQVKGKYA